MDSWKMLEERFPFQDLLDEVPALNARFGLRGDVAFSPDLRPVFFVGDLESEPDVLVIGLKPGLNADSNSAFQRERGALQGTFAEYRSSRVEYFLSDALNQNHYRPTAKAVAELLDEPFPAAIGPYLHAHALQAELLPFFAPHAGLDAHGFASLRADSKGGQLADAVVQTLLRARPWKAILIRYRLTFDVFRRVFTIDSSGDKATLNVDGHTIPAYCLPGQYVADAAVLGLRAGQALRPSSQRPSSGRSRGRDASSAFKEIERFVLALGSDVTPLPRRANGSFVFRRRRNFVTLIPSATGLKIDVYIGGSDWHNGVRVTPGGIGVDEAKRLVRRAYELASR